MQAEYCLMKSARIAVVAFALLALTAAAQAEASDDDEDVIFESGYFDDSGWMEDAGYVWDFYNFYNPYSVWGSATCNVSKNQRCPSEIGWQGRSITFAFNIKDMSALSEDLDFEIGVGYFINRQYFEIYAGHGGSVKKLKSLWIGAGGAVITAPKKVFAKGSNFIQVVMPNARVGYGMPSQGFVFDSASLYDNDRSFDRPSIECPEVPVYKKYLLGWDKGEFRGSDFILQFGTDPEFSKGSFFGVQAGKIPKKIGSKAFKRMLKQAAKTEDGVLYMRMRAKHPLKGKAYSNMCSITLAG